MAAPSPRKTTSTSPSVRQPLPITARGYACTAIDPRLHHTRRTCLRRHHKAPTSSSPQHPRDPHPCKRPLPQDPIHPLRDMPRDTSPLLGSPPWDTPWDTHHETLPPPHGTLQWRSQISPDRCLLRESPAAPMGTSPQSPTPHEDPFGPSPPLDTSTGSNGTPFPMRGRGAQWC